MMLILVLQLVQGFVNLVGVSDLHSPSNQKTKGKRCCEIVSRGMEVIEGRSVE